MNAPERLLHDLDFVRGLARQLCTDPHTADDVAQDTLLRAIDHGEAHVRDRRGWLARITRNLASNARRSAARRRGREHARPRADAVPSAAEVSEQEEQRRRVVALVQELPEPFRAVVLLRHYRGFDTRRCATELGVPESTVRTRLKRALDKLRERLDAQSGGDRRAWMAALMPLAWPVGGEGGAVAAAGARAGRWAVAGLLLVAVGAVAVLVRDVWRPVDAPRLATSDVAGIAVGEPGPATAEVDAQDRDASRTEPEPRASRAPEPARLVVPVFAGAVPGPPVTGARVRATVDWVELRGWDPRPLGETTTDANGHIVLSLDPLRELEPALLRRLAVYFDIDAEGHLPSHEDRVWLGAWDRRGTLRGEALVMQPRDSVKGRVTDAHGNTLRDALVFTDANGTWLGAARTAIDGTFAMRETAPGRTHRMFALHPSSGCSRIVTVRQAQAGETRVADLVCERPMAQIVGTVRYADGTPAAGVEVIADTTVPTTASPPEASLLHDGVDVGRMLCHSDQRVTTDAQGRFAFRARPPLEHVLRFGGVEHVTTARPVAAPIELELPGRRIDIEIRDRFGYPLTAPCWARYLWIGEDAAIARRRFATEGPSVELLESATRLNFQEELRMPDDGDAFLVCEASSSDRDWFYGSAWLPAGATHATATVRPHATDDRPRGTVRVATGQTIRFKVCRVYGTDAIGMAGSAWDDGNSWSARQRAATGGRVRSSQVFGAWRQLPADGHIRALPAGALTFEFLVGDGDDAELHVRKVMVPAGGVAEVAIE